MKITIDIDEASGKVETETTFQSEPREIKVYGGKMKDGSKAYVRIIDLRLDMPCFDSKGNMYEGYTTLVRINAGPWLSSEVDSALINLYGPRFRIKELRRLLAEHKLNVKTLKDSEGNPI